MTSMNPKLKDGYKIFFISEFLYKDMSHIVKTMCDIPYLVLVV